MNHPTPEEWMPYLFGETRPETRHQLKQHLRSCAECRHQLENWEHGLAQLDTWKLASPVKAGPFFIPILKWTTATAVVLLIGFSVGRFSASQADVSKVRALIEPQLRHELSRELAQFVHEEVERSASVTLTASSQQTGQALASFAKAIQERRTEDNRAINAALDRLAAQSLAQFVSLKKDLETVALNTDAEFRDTAQGLVQLVGYTRPVGK